MKYLTILLLLITTNLSAQVYNKADTTWTLQYGEVLTIRNKIEAAKQERQLLEKEIEVLTKLNNTKDIVIKKQLVRDSLYSMELNKYKEMDDIMRKTLYTSNDIINNYKVLLMSAEDNLKAEAKKAKRERAWKNFYKYLAGGGAVAAGILILK